MLARHETFLHIPQLQVVHGKHVFLLFLLRIDMGATVRGAAPHVRRALCAGGGGLGLRTPRVAPGFWAPGPPCTEQVLSEESWYPGPAEHLWCPMTFKPFPRAQGGKAEGGSQSHPKQALDAVQAGPSQGPRPQSLSPRRPGQRRPASDKLLTSFPDCGDRETEKGGPPAAPGPSKGRLSPLPPTHPCVSNQAHGTDPEVVRPCVQRVCGRVPVRTHAGPSTYAVTTVCQGGCVHAFVDAGGNCEYLCRMGRARGPHRGHTHLRARGLFNRIGLAGALWEE